MYELVVQFYLIIKLYFKKNDIMKCGRVALIYQMCLKSDLEHSTVHVQFLI